MSPSPLNLLVITASVREERFGAVVAQWFYEQACLNHRFDAHQLDLSDVELPHRLPPTIEALGMRTGRSAEMQSLYEKLEAAEAFVVVTPEYNHGYPASIKHLIDWHFSTWMCKPVAFVSYGGVAGGLRAVEQLRQVFAEMHAVTLRDTVSFDRFWEQFDSAGTLIAPDMAKDAAEILLERLSWWALTLRLGRAELPYG